MNRIIPTVFAISNKDFEIRFNELVGVSKKIQIDIMDGKFVNETSIQISDIPRLKKYKNRFEAHLMVKEPRNYIKELKEKGFKKIIFHFEALKEIRAIKNLVFLIKSYNIEPWVAFNVETSFGYIINTIESVQDLKGIMLMGHVPGKEHFGLESNVLRKIENIRKINKKIPIQVDGGINPENIGRLSKLGVNYFNLGSFVSESKDPKKAIESLVKELK